MDDARRIEVSLIGEPKMRLTWSVFLSKAEKTALRFVGKERKLLEAAAPGIVTNFKSYFPDRRAPSTDELASRLSLKLLCFYTDLPFHVWYSGDSSFNHLDVDITVDASFRVTEIRFDG